MATTNLSRRNFAKGAAIAGALASIPAAAVLADDTEAGAELLELGRQLAALFEDASRMKAPVLGFGRSFHGCAD